MVTLLLGKLFLLLILPALNLGQKVGILTIIFISIVIVVIIPFSMIVISTKVGSYKENTHLKLDIEECTGVENCKKGFKSYHHHRHHWIISIILFCSEHRYHPGQQLEVRKGDNLKC